MWVVGAGLSPRIFCGGFSQLPAQLDWLDVGCGTGALTEVILDQTRPRSVTGMDPSGGFVDHAKAHITDPRATFEVADAQSLPVESERFDTAVAGLVLNFVPKPLLAVQEMARRSATGRGGCSLRLGLRRKDGIDALLLGRGGGIG